ncbi:nucleotidyl transferase AbiEii/AbiGii toxin family protein [Candidatus Gottesmanbacteria bacterium]|nr:nucleotidyl transferase AbiEii/AbiGii toxin family protein [Candidatus Gottesmanbacteria bacterium]
MELNQAQKIAISLLSKSPLKKTFYWTGGTLLAYHYLHHRKSLDLDFFSEQSFSFEDIHALAKTIKEKMGYPDMIYQKIFDRWEFIFKNGNTLRVEFVHYNHEKKTLKARSTLLGIKIDSLEDIAANKTLAYFDRNEPKDLFDIYFLLTKVGFSETRLLELVNKKFGIKFAESLFWSEAYKSLPLLASIQPLMFGHAQEQTQLIKTIEDYFKEHSNQYLAKYLKA